MISPFGIDLRPEIAAALQMGRPVVAMESALITHGLPFSQNLQTARAAEIAVREQGGVPAIIGVLHGVPTVGLMDSELAALAKTSAVVKAGRRDLGMVASQGQTAGTTVSATMYLAHRMGIRFFATGGIGGAHPGPANSWDISADLLELARTPVAVVCAGAKSILDIIKTLEILESLSVLVIGYGADEFPAFYLASSGAPVQTRVDSPDQAASLLKTNWNLGGAGAVLAQPVHEKLALDPKFLEDAMAKALTAVKAASIRGPALTPFLLQKLAEETQGKSVLANHGLVVANARLAAQIAKSFYNP
jgi:pseudouridylate synthase